MSGISQHILISGLLLIFTGSYTELPSSIRLLAGTDSTCCSGGGKCCCGENAASGTSRDGSCSIACAGCCHHTPVSVSQITREFYPKATISSEDIACANMFQPYSPSPYTLLLTKDISRPPTV
jgi:hypothetical protein